MRTLLTVTILLLTRLVLAQNVAPRLQDIGVTPGRSLQFTVENGLWKGDTTKTVGAVLKYSGGGRNLPIQPTVGKSGRDIQLYMSGANTQQLPAVSYLQILVDGEPAYVGNVVTSYAGRPGTIGSPVVVNYIVNGGGGVGATEIANAIAPLSLSVTNLATGLASRLLTSTYTANRIIDQAATTAAQNTANTALTVAGSATATAAQLTSQIGSVSATVGGKVDKATTVTVNGVTQSLSGPVSFSVDVPVSQSLTAVSQLPNDAGYQTGAQVGAALSSAVNSVTAAQQVTDNNQTLSLSQKLSTASFNSFTATQAGVDAGQSLSIVQNATDIAGKLSTSTYTSNRSADQAATTTAQNTANTALSTANSATATLGGKVDKATTVTINGVSQPLSGPVSFTIAGTGSTTLTQVSQLSNDANYQSGGQVATSISSATATLAGSQTAVDAAQNTDIASRVLTSTYNTNRSSDQAATSAAQTTANTALSTANSATATGASNGTAITAIQNANYQTAAQVTSAVSSATATVANSQTAVDAAQNTQIAAKLPASFSATQASRDAAQDSDIGNRLLTSTYNTNRTTDQSATTAAQNTANTALSTANSATATGASNATAITALQNAGYQTAGQVASAVNSATATVVSNQTAVDAAQNTNINSRVLTSTYNSFTAAQQTLDNNQASAIAAATSTANSATATGAANTSALAGKQAIITSGSSLTAGSIVVNGLSTSDSLSSQVPTMKNVRDFVNLKMPSFIDFPYDSTYFTFGSQLGIKPAAFRGLFTPGTGVSIVNGVISATATGGSSSTNVITGTDPNNTANQATFILSPGDRAYLGSASKPLYAVNFGNVQTLESVPNFRFSNGGLTLGGDADATVTRINNVVSFNSSSTGTGLDNGYAFYGSPTRYMKINESNGDKAPLLVRISTSGSMTVTGGVSTTAVQFPDGTSLTTSPITSVTTLTDLAAAKTRLVSYDGSIWERKTGNVSSDLGVNSLYTATQYNAGSDRYERQFNGRAQFAWWKNSSGNTWEQMKYATNSKLEIQVANGDYYFNERVYITPLTKVYGNEITPDSVRFHITGPNPFLFMSWFWFDGTPGKRAEGIVLAGFSLYNESTFVANKDQNDFYGPISIDGGGARNIIIRNINYKQVSTTAIVNAILVKMGTNKDGDGVLIDNVRSLSSTVAGRMLVEILNQGDGYNTSNPERTQIPARNVILRNCIADNFRFGLSVAGNFVGAYIHNNIVRNCTDYGIEVAGPQPGVRVERNGFGGSHNVLIAGNAEGSIAADYMAAGQGQYYRDNYTEGTLTGTGGIIEIRGGGDLVFTGNKLRIGGGIFLRRTSAGGVVSADFSDNLIVSTATASNMTNKALLYLAGATNVRGFGNTFIRTSTDTQPYVQAATSTATSGYTATGVNSTGALFFNNMFLGTTTPTSYFSATSPNTITSINNINQSGVITN